MFVMSNFLVAIANILSMVLTLLYWAIIIRVLISWVNPDPWNPIVQMLSRITDPILVPIRNALPFLSMGLDFSPIVAILGIYFTRSFLVQTLIDIAVRLK